MTATIEEVDEELARVDRQLKLARENREANDARIATLTERWYALAEMRREIRKAQAAPT